MIPHLKRSHIISVQQVFHLSGPLLGVLLLVTPSELLAHAGHGDEFHQSSPSQSTEAINVDAETAQRIGLVVEPVDRQSLSFGIQATGQIESLPSGFVNVTNPVGGTVVALLVEPGDAVEAGQPLAIITSGELAELRIAALENSAERQGDVQQAQANLRLAQENYDRQQQIAQIAFEQAETELRVAQEQYDRDRELAEQGAIPRRDFLESEANLALARKAVTEAQSQLEVLEARTEVERAQTDMEVAQSRAQLSAGTYSTRLRQLGAEANPDGTITIKAPISGVVAERDVTLGQSAEDAGATLMTIVDDRTVLATANVYEKDLSRISAGQAVRVTIPSLSNRIFEGRIASIGAVVDGESRVVPVRVELANPQGVLKPGMFAELEVLTDRTPEPVLAIPQSAIVEANGQSLVFVENGTQFEPVEVVLGRQAGSWIEVEQGLFEGDRIVTQRANQLYAQSLRGGSPSADDAAVEEVSSDTPSLPLWMVLAGGAGLAIATFGAGAVWASRRSLSPRLSSLESSSGLSSTPNGSYALTSGDRTPGLSAESHAQSSEIQSPPH